MLLPKERDVDILVLADTNGLSRVAQWIRACITRPSVVKTTCSLRELYRVWGGLIPQWDTNEAVSREKVPTKDKKAALEGLLGSRGPPPQRRERPAEEEHPQDALPGGSPAEMNSAPSFSTEAPLSMTAEEKEKMEADMQARKAVVHQAQRSVAAKILRHSRERPGKAAARLAA